MISIIELVLNLLGTALGAAKVGGVAADAIAGLEAAIQALEKVRGSDVTFGQLESLRVKPTWPNA